MHVGRQVDLWDEHDPERVGTRDPSGDLVACVRPSGWFRPAAQHRWQRQSVPAHCRLRRQLRQRRRPATSIPRRRRGGGATATACARRRRRSGGRRQPVRTIAGRDRCADLGTRSEAHPPLWPRQGARTPTIGRASRNRARIRASSAATTPTASPSTVRRYASSDSSGSTEAVTRAPPLSSRQSRPARRHRWSTASNASRAGSGALPSEAVFRSDGRRSTSSSSAGYGTSAGASWATMSVAIGIAGATPSLRIGSVGTVTAGVVRAG